MALRRTMNDTDFVRLEPGTYPVTCVDIKPDTLENAQFGTGDVIRLKLQFDDVLDENGEEVTRDAIANDKLTPLSKLTTWLVAFNVKASIGEEVDLEECIGKKALAVVTMRKKDDKEYDRIENLLPATRQRDASKDVADMDVSEWWALTRKEGHERKRIMELSESMFGREVKDLSGQERSDLYAAL